MEKRKHKYWLGIILVWVMINIFAGCISLRDAEQKEQTMEPPKWKTVYAELLQQTLEECKTKQRDRKGFGEYGLYDFDQDGIPELFMNVYEDNVMDDYFRVYDCENNKLIYLDKLGAGNAWIWGTHIPNAVIVVFYGAWKVQGWLLKRYENGEFQDDFRPEVLAEINYAGASWQETKEYPCTNIENTPTDITKYALDDLLGLELYE